jgi:hypothetical protein
MIHAPSSLWPFSSTLSGAIWSSKQWNTSCTRISCSAVGSGWAERKPLLTEIWHTGPVRLNSPSTFSRVTVFAVAFSDVGAVE